MEAVRLLTISTFAGAFLYADVILSPVSFVMDIPSYTKVQPVTPFMIIFFVFLLGGALGAYVISSMGAHYAVTAGGFLILIGGYIGAAGVAVGEDELMIAGWCILGGFGGSTCYIGPQYALELWYPNNKSFASAVAISGFSLGPLFATIIVHYTFDWWDGNIEFFFIITSTVTFIAIVANFKLLQGPSHSHNPKCLFVDSCTVPLPFNHGVKIPKLYLSISDIVRHRNFFCLATSVTAAYVCAGSAPAFVVKSAVFVGGDALTYETMVPAFQMLEIFFACAFIGRVVGGLLPKLMDLKVVLLIGYIIQIVISAVFANELRTSEAFHITQTFKFWYIGFQGLFFGLVSGGIVGYLYQYFGEFLNQVLHGVVLSCSGLGSIVIAIVFFTFESQNDPFSIFSIVASCFASVGCISLTGVVTDPCRVLLDQLQPRATMITYLVNGYEIDWQTRTILSAPLKYERICDFVAIHPGIAVEMDARIPQKREEISWIFWSLKSILLTSLVGSLALSLFLYVAPLLALAITITEKEADEGDNLTCHDVIGDQSNKGTRYVIFTAFALFFSYCGIVFELVWLSRTLVAGIRALKDRISDGERFVFGNSSKDEDSFSLIREIFICGKSTQKLGTAVRSFSYFVPETTVRKALRNTAYRRPYGEKSRVTIMFMEIALFSELIQTLDDESLGKAFGIFTEEISDVVDAHKGVIAELLDGGLLAFWNTPDTVENHELLACECALSLHATVEKLSVFFQIEWGFPRLFCNIGINTGYVTSGVIGVARKMKFGAIGDAMNLASRLKGLCKFFGVRTIVSENAVNKSVLAKMTLLKLNDVLVAGKLRAIGVYQIIGVSSETNSSEKSMIDTYTAALDSCKAGRLTESRDLLANISGVYGKDLRISRLQRIVDDGISTYGDNNPDWSGGCDKFTAK